MSHDVFLSYASSDRAAADQVCAALESRGLRCWMAPRNVLPGEDWGMAILAAIAAARCMVVVHSAATGNSVHVRNEVVTATSQRLAIVPVRVDEAPPGGALRLHLAAWHWLTATPPPIAAHTDTLVTGVRASFADMDATVNLAIRRPGPPQPVAVAAAPAPRPPQPMPPPSAAPPPQTAARPAPPPRRPSPPGPPAERVTPVPAAAPSRRASPLALLVIGGSMLVVTGLTAWFLVLGPGRAWLPLSRAAEPRVQLATAPEPPRPMVVIPIAAEPTPAPGGSAAAPTPSPEASPAPSVPAPGPGPSGPVQGGAGAAPPSSLDTVEPRSQPRAPQQQAAQPVPQQQQSPPPAQQAMVAVHNAGRQDIEELFVSPVAETTWGADWLGMAQITPGNRVLVPRPPEHGCLFDLRVVWRDRTVEELRRQDLCATTDYRFDGSKARAAGGGR